jgi:hypothetical protein
MNEAGPSRQCWRLDDGTQTWISSGMTPSATALGNAEMIRGQAYLFGGCPDTDLSHCSTSVLRRQTSGSWEKIGQVPDGPVAMSAVSVAGDHVYIFGGCSKLSPKGVRNHDEAFRFDPVTGHWKTLRPVPESVRSMTAVTVSQRYILLAGGYNDSSVGFSSASYFYDTEDDRYIPVTSLPLSVMDMEMILYDRSLWGLGGEDKQRHRTPCLIETKLPE